MSDSIVVNVLSPEVTNINVTDTGENIYINPLTLNQGIINHSVTHQSGGSDELLHNLLGGLQGGSGGSYYHLTSGQYANLVTGTVVRPSDTGAFYPNSNPSGFITGVDLSAYVTGDVVRPSETGSFITASQTGAFYPRSNPSGFITGVDLSAYVTGDVVRPSETGIFYLASNPSGFITGVDLSAYVTGSVVRPSETGDFINFNSLTGDRGDVTVTGNSSSNLNFSIDNFAITSGKIADSAVTTAKIANFNVTTDKLSSLSVTTNIIATNAVTNTKLADMASQRIKGRISAGTSDPEDLTASQVRTLIDFDNTVSGLLSGYVTGSVVRPSETGAFYAASNPSGFITGVDLSFSGNYYTKSESESRYVNTTGTETILGDKTFHDKVYINSLYVTGLETIVNTTNTNVASNFIMLNLTGGAVDGGLFFVTGAGLTGINDSGAILGFDHSDKFKFGIGTRASDLSVLDTIASVEEMTGISGSLQTQISTLSNATGSYVLNSQTGAFYAASNPSGFITGVDLSTYATITNLAATGSTLQTNINNLSGVYATISNLNSTGSSLDSKINLLSGSSVLLYGDQTISGIKTFTTGVNISGNLTVDTNTLFVDAANDKVGVGTSSALIGKLDVAGSLTTTTPSDVLVLSRPYNPGVAFHTAASFRLSNPNTNVINTRLDIALQSGNASSPVTPDTTVMTLLGDGRIGIGTTAPTSGYKLHVNGAARISGNMICEGSLGVGTTSPSTPLHTYTAGNNSLTIEAGTGDSQVMLRSGGSLRFLFGYEDSDDGFRIYNYGTSSTALFVKSTTGNIGIGTTSPTEKLTVSGNISASGNVTASNLVYTTSDQTIAGAKTFSDNIVGNGTANRLPNQLAVASSDIITKGLADSRYTSRNKRIIDDTTFVQTTWEQFLDFDDQYNADLNVLTASGASTFGASPVFGDTFTAGNILPVGISFSGNDAHTHRGVFLVRGPTGNSQAFYININRTTIPYNLTNRIDEFTSRVLVTGVDFATQGYFKIGPVPKGGTGGGDSSLVGGLLFNPYLHPTNLVLAVNKSTTVTPFTFTTTAANVDFLDTGFNFTDLINKWVNITYKVDRTVGPTVTIIITRENVILFQASYNTATHPTISTWVRRASLHTTGASNEIGLQSGHFVYTAPNRSQLFMDYLHYKVTGTSAAPSNWNSLRF